MSYLSISIYIPSCKYVVEYKQQNTNKPDRFVCKFNNSDLHVRHVILKILNLLGGCKYKIYNMTKFRIYTQPVNSKFTI